MIFTVSQFSLKKCIYVYKNNKSTALVIETLSFIGLCYLYYSEEMLFSSFNLGGQFA